MVTSASRSFTRSARTQDLVSSSLSCDSFKASCSLHRNRARCDTSRSSDPGLRASPPLAEVFLDRVEGWGTVVVLVDGRLGRVTGTGGLEEDIGVVVVEPTLTVVSGEGREDKLSKSSLSLSSK